MKVKNIVLLTVDSLRNVDLQVNFYDNVVNNLHRVGVTFPIMLFSLSYSNGPGTNQSFPSIMSSTPFLVHGGLRLKDGVPSLAEILTRNGFYAVGFHSNPFLSRRFGWDRGFTEFYDFLGEYRSPAGLVVSSSGGLKRLLIDIAGKLLKGSNKRLWSLVNRLYYKVRGFNLPYIEACELNKHVLRWVERNRDRLNRMFLWVHYMDVHFPFAPPDKYLSGTGFSSRSEAFFYNYRLNFENPDPEIVSKLRRLYEASVKYVIDSIVYLLEELNKYGFLDDSLVIITSDHGEAFLEHGKFGHAYDILYNEVLRVPLIIGGTSVDANKLSYDGSVQLMDLVPTIVDLVGAKRPPTFRGRSLAKLLRGEINRLEPYPIFSESAVPDLINLRYDTSRYIVSVILNKWKLILDRIHSHNPIFELYNLEKDPDEKHNLLEEHRDVAEDLMKLIDLHLDDVDKLKKLSERINTLKLRLKKK